LSIAAASACLAAQGAQAIVCAGPVPCGCTVGVAGVPFGIYDPLSSVPLDSVGLIQMSCNGGGGPSAMVTIELAAGNSGNVANRMLKAGNIALRYNLYLDAGHTRVWGEDAASALVTPFPTSQQQYTIYGRVPPRQNVGPGTYRDSIMVTVQY
jgi:spore coat protein U-like protein